MQIPGLSDRIRIRDRRVEIRGGGGCMPIIGVALFLIGCGPIVAIVARAWVLKEAIEYIGVPWITLFFLVAGVVVTFARYRFDLDGEARTYRKRLGLFKSGKEESGSLDEFDQVTLRRCVRPYAPSERRTWITVYPIHLVGPRGDLQVWEGEELDTARNQAEQVAKALGFPLTDLTGPERIVREAGHLDESLREQRRRKGELPPELPPVPQGMKTRVRVEGRELVFDLPPDGWPRHAVSGAVGALFIAAFGCGLLLVGLSLLRGAPDLIVCAFGVLFCCFAFLGFVVSPLLGAGRWLLKSRYTTHTVRVSPDRLHVTARGLLSSRAAEIPAAELEELRLDLSREEPACVAEFLARSDRTTIRFGGRLSAEEANWIKSVLEQILTA